MKSIKTILLGLAATFALAAAAKRTKSKLRKAATA